MINKALLIIKENLSFFYCFLIITIIFLFMFFWNESEKFSIKKENLYLLNNSNYNIKIDGKRNKKNTDYIYTSSNENIAYVTLDGTIKTYNEGSASIIVKSKTSNKTKVINVRVDENRLYNLSFDNLDFNMIEGEKLLLKPNINDSKKYDVSLEWSSSNDEVVSVDDGMLTALNEGVCYISVKAKDSLFYSRVRVTVLKKKSIIKKNDSKLLINKKDNDALTSEKEIDDYIHVNDIKLNVINNILKVNDSVQVNYELFPNDATNKNVLFKSNDENIAIVSSAGLITALNPGVTDIIVRSEDGNKSSFVRINVVGENQLETFNLNKNKVGLVVGDTFKLNIDYFPNDAINKNIVFTSSDEEIVSVDSTGLIKALSEGNAIISAISDSGIIKHCEVNVSEREVEIQSISISPAFLNLDVGDTYKLDVLVNPYNSTNKTITYTSNNNKVVSIDNEGNITALEKGNAIISAYVDGKESKSNVRVNNVLVKSIVLSNTKSLIKQNETFKLDTSIFPLNVTNNNISYKSSNSKIALVSQDGVVTGVGLGEVIISANAQDGSNKSASFVLKVVPDKDLIDIRGKKYKTYKKNIEVFYEGNQKHIQNFAISNIFTENETIFLSTVAKGTLLSEDLTKEEHEDLLRGIVYKITNDNVETMYLEGSGHGQDFDIEADDTIWTNAKGSPYYVLDKNKKRYWSTHYAIQRIKFKENKKDTIINPLNEIEISADNKELKGPTPCIDEENNMIALIFSGSLVKVYDLNDFKNGKLTLLYKTKLNVKQPTKYIDFNDSEINAAYSKRSDYSHVTLPVQGYAFKDGYIYKYSGCYRFPSFIEVFNLNGESLYYSRVEEKKDFKKIMYYYEAEGIKIYDNKIFVGYTYNSQNPDYKFEIGYLE